MTSGRSCGSPGDVLRLHLRVAGVKQAHRVAPLAENRGQRLNSQGRKCHHLDPPVVRLRPVQFRREHPAEVVVADVNKKCIHGLVRHLPPATPSLAENEPWHPRWRRLAAFYDGMIFRDAMRQRLGRLPIARRWAEGGG